MYPCLELRRYGATFFKNGKKWENGLTGRGQESDRRAARWLCERRRVPGRKSWPARAVGAILGYWRSVAASPFYAACARTGPRPPPHRPQRPTPRRRADLGSQTATMWALPGRAVTAPAFLGAARRGVVVPGNMAEIRFKCWL